MTGNLFDLIRECVPDTDKVVIETPAGRRLTYGDMLEHTGRIANVLRALGVQTGDRVAAQVEKSPEAIMLYLACLRSGAVYLPLNTAYTAAELSYFLGDATPALLVCRPESREEIEQIATEVGVPAIETLGSAGDGSLIDRVADADPYFADVKRSGDSLAAILYTSGTTGRSKGAMLTHENLASNARALMGCWQFSDNDVLLHALPIYHTHGLFVATNTVLLSGASMLFLARFDAREVLGLIPRASVMMGVPTFYSRLLALPDLSGEQVANMRVFISGSAPLSAEVHRAFQERTGMAILERYGMTETSMNTSNPYAGERRAGTVGFPLPGVELRITDPESGTPLANGEIGAIEIRGPNVFKGYWQMPEKTAEEFREDDYFITGDLGLIDERGYLHIVGRDKDLIISGGLNVYPAEVEAAIDSVAGVAESAVIGVPHADFGEAVTAVVAPHADDEVSASDIRDRLAGELAAFKRPKRIFFVDALPRNSMGKIQKNVLRERYRDTYQNG